MRDLLAIIRSIDKKLYDNKIEDFYSNKSNSALAKTIS